MEGSSAKQVVIKEEDTKSPLRILTVSKEGAIFYRLQQNQLVVE